MMLSRRAVLTGASAALLSLPMATAALPQAADDDPYPLPPFDYSNLPAPFRPAVVAYTGRQLPGTIIVDTPNRQIYLVQQGGQAMRWGCAVGKDGFRWAGLADVGRKVMWPRWTPPKEMIARVPEKAKWANGMPGGPDNPLGARALYLFDGGRDTMFRIHGTNEPWSIGQNVSSGCIRMLNEHVTELHRMVEIDAKVIVL
jgi:lipoprotein-anchoring transpeptidase ErfK/SrfK